MNSQTSIHAFHAPTLIAFLLASLSASAQEAQESPAERLAKIIKRDAESIKSVEVVERLDSPVPKPDPDDGTRFNYMVDHYIETADGSRYFERRGIRQEATAYREIYWGFQDLFAQAIYDHTNPERQQMVRLQKKFAGKIGVTEGICPRPYFIAMSHSPRCTKCSQTPPTSGAARFWGRACERFLFLQVTWGPHRKHDQIFHIDSETGLVLKVEYFKTAEDRAAGKHLWFWTAEAVDTVQGHPVVIQSTTIMPATDQYEERHTKFHTESIEFNKAYPEDQFTYKILPGANVLDFEGLPINPVPIILSPRPGNPSAQSAA